MELKASEYRKSREDVETELAALGFNVDTLPDLGYMPKSGRIDDDMPRSSKLTYDVAGHLLRQSGFILLKFLGCGVSALCVVALHTLSHTHMLREAVSQSVSHCV